MTLSSLLVVGLAVIAVTGIALWVRRELALPSAWLSLPAEARAPMLKPDDFAQAHRELLSR